MCTSHKVKKQKSRWLTHPLFYAVMIALGIWVGLSDGVVLKAVGQCIAELFIRAFKCVSLPIIGLSIIVTLAQQPSAQQKMRQIARRTLYYTFGTTFIAACVSFVLYLLIQPEVALSPTAQNVAVFNQHFSYGEHIAHLIPESFLAPFLEQQVFTVLFLSVVVGLAVRFVPEPEAQASLIHFFKGVHGLLMVMTRWIINIMPIGLFGFMTTTVVQLQQGQSLKSIGQYLLVVVLANIVQGLIILPLWLKSQGMRPWQTLIRMLPALSLAFFSKSSVGTLPVTMQTVENNLGVKKDLSRFVLPLCTSINMNGCAAFIFATVVYLMQSHGVHLSLWTMGIWVFVATVAAIGNAGVPMGCFFLSASLLASLNVPITLMGLILPFYSLIDMLETALNVWSDACVVSVVDHKMKVREQGRIPANEWVV